MDSCIEERFVFVILGVDRDGYFDVLLRLSVQLRVGGSQEGEVRVVEEPLL